MAYVALYRKYRSQNFEELMGQDSVTTTLQNAIRTRRIAQAYLFYGARGCGKTSTARLLSRALNCVAQDGPTPTPCGTCTLCVSIREGTCMDVVEIDAASETGVDNVREKIIENVQYASSEARYKVYIIDEVHDLSSKAFDALLKTIEEPPPHVIFVLATTEFHKVPITIRSRCQCYQFKRGSIQDLSKAVERVVRAEGFTAAPEAIQTVARSAEGSWRDALSILEQVLAYSDGHVSAETVNRALGTVGSEMLARVTATLAEGAWNSTLDIAAELVDSGTDVRQLMTSLGGHLRDLMLLATGAKQAAAQELGPDRIALLQAQTRLFTPAMLLDMMAELSAGERELRFSNQHRVILERTLCRLMMIGQGTYGSAVIVQGAEGATTKSGGSTMPTANTRPRSEARPTPTVSDHSRPDPSRPEPAAPSPPPPRPPSSLSPRVEPDVAEEMSETTQEAPTAPRPTSPPPASSPGRPTPSPTVGGGGIDTSRHQFAEEITLEVIRRSWDRITKEYRRKSPLGADFLEKAHVAALEGKTIVLIFTDSFARDRIQSKIQAVEKWINEYLKVTGYRLQCLKEGPTEGGGSHKPADQGGTAVTVEMEALLDTPIVQPTRSGPARVMDFELPTGSPASGTSAENEASGRVSQSSPSASSVQTAPSETEQSMVRNGASSDPATYADTGVSNGFRGESGGSSNSTPSSNVNARVVSDLSSLESGEPDPSDGMLEDVLRVFGGYVIDTD